MEEDQKVTVPISAEAAERIPRLYEEWLEIYKSELDEGHRLIDRIVKIAEMRISFFDKIVLLAGGSFALSLTFLASLQRYPQRPPIKGMWTLELAWCLLLASMVLSWLHNRHRTVVAEAATYMLGSRVKQYFAHQAARTVSLAGKALGGCKSPDLDLGAVFEGLSGMMKESGVEMGATAKKMTGIFTESQAIARKIGEVAFFALVCAFLLMLIFAIKNLSLL